MKNILFIAILFQVFSSTLFAHTVEYIDNRLYETQEEAESIAARDEVNGVEIFHKEDHLDLYAKINSTLDSVYEKAKRNLAPYYSNFPERPIFILANMDALLPMHVDGSNKSTNILYVSKKTAKGDALEGVLAHELSHYILDHGKEDQGEPIETVRHVSTNPIVDSVICSTVNGYGNEIESEVKDLIDYMLSSTTLVEEDTMGVPFDIKYHTPLLEQLMSSSIFGKYLDKKSCEEAGDLRDTIAVDIYVKYCSLKGIQECRIPSDIKEKLPQMISEFKSKAKLCLEGEEEHFDATLRELVGDDLYQTLKGAFENNDYSSFPKPERAKSQIELLFSDKNPMDRIIDMYQFGVSYLDKNFEELKINKRELRLITSEDEADMLAQVILIDQDETKNSFAISRLQYMTESEKKYCQDKVAKDEMPKYGFLNGIHHSQCWRYWRSVKLKKELKDTKKKDLLIRTLLNFNLKPSTSDSNMHLWY